jgi:signal transduction histidine kinase
LIGMRERVSAVGGQLDTGAQGDGTFAVHAVLPAHLRDASGTTLVTA